jgi:hypothetical protein
LRAALPHAVEEGFLRDLLLPEVGEG